MFLGVDLSGITDLLKGNFFHNFLKLGIGVGVGAAYIEYLHDGVAICIQQFNQYYSNIMSAVQMMQNVLN